jgi:tryptophan synthase alpha subunit
MPDITNVVDTVNRIFAQVPLTILIPRVVSVTVLMMYVAPRFMYTIESIVLLAMAFDISSVLYLDTTIESPQKISQYLIVLGISVLSLLYLQEVFRKA